ncbi:serine hydrolase domain-containing protein [Streptomyces varsoviensis]|uniref:serine hydrolase domain-containing protein n=1 Tax=Streptomyces varsoviensis TaxID=67373 RepID=UPI0033EBAD80
MNTCGPVPSRGYFRMASTSKTPVATVVLQLEAENRLSLDDTVDHWLPRVVRGNGNDGSQMTIRHLLQHTSGVGTPCPDTRFPHAVEGPWDRATRMDARDFICWIPGTVKPRMAASQRRSARAVGAPNPMTGKAGPGPGYAPRPSRPARQCCAGSTTCTVTPDPGHCSTHSRWPRRVVPAARTHTTTRWMPEHRSEQAVTGLPFRAGFRARSQASGSTRCSRRCRRTGTGHDRVLGLQRSPGLGADRRPAVRYRPETATGRRCAGRLPSTAAGSGLGGCVRMAAALSAGAARAGAARPAQPVWWTLNATAEQARARNIVLRERFPPRSAEARWPATAQSADEVLR